MDHFQDNALLSIIEKKIMFFSRRKQKVFVPELNAGTIDLRSAKKSLEIDAKL